MFFGQQRLRCRSCFFLLDEGVEFIHLHRVGFTRNRCFRQFFRMLLDPFHHGCVADLQVSTNLTKVEPICVHPDCQCANFFWIAMLLFLRRVSSTAFPASIALTACVCETIFLLVVFIFTFWTSHALILSISPLYRPLSESLRSSKGMRLWNVTQPDIFCASAGERRDF